MAWTMKYPAATMPIRTIGSRIKSQSLFPPPPGPFTTASGCPHSGQIGAPSKQSDRPYRREYNQLGLCIYHTGRPYPWIISQEPGQKAMQHCKIVQVWRPN